VHREDAKHSQGRKGKETLTIHLRSGDIFGLAHQHQQHRQPPCSLYRRIIQGGIDGKRFKKVYLVTEMSAAQRLRAFSRAWRRHRNPCIDMIMRMASKPPRRQSQDLRRQRLPHDSLLAVKVMGGSLESDACALLRAQNLVVAYSTFSAALALLSSRVSRIYGVSVPYLTGCRLAPGVSFQRFEVPGMEELRPDLQENVFWMKSYSGKRIREMAPC